VLAQMGEETKVAEANHMLRMEARLDRLEQQGGGAGYPGMMGAPGGAATGAGVVPVNAPAGYVPPPMEVSGIPAAGGRY